RRALPAQLAGLEGVTLGVRVCPPQTSAAPRVTQIATEHSLAERRLMRLDLRDFHARLSSNVELKLAVEDLREEGDTAVARVRWGFVDWEAGGATEARTQELRLTRVAGGWRIQQAWDFLSQVVASR
ncbi:MAG: hypothetical protein AB1505_13385, partial [Candidatus Latescibacterota bacterium]